MGIPLNPLAPALDIPGEFSRQASFWTPRRASLTLATVEPLERAGLRSLEISITVRAYLTLQEKEESWQFTFLPVGRAFLGGSRCSTVPLWNS